MIKRDSLTTIKIAADPTPNVIVLRSLFPMSQKKKIIKVQVPKKGRVPREVITIPLQERVHVPLFPTATERTIYGQIKLEGPLDVTVTGGMMSTKYHIGAGDCTTGKSSWANEHIRYTATIDPNGRRVLTIRCSLFAVATIGPNSSMTMTGF